MNNALLALLVVGSSLALAVLAFVTTLYVRWYRSAVERARRALRASRATRLAAIEDGSDAKVVGTVVLDGAALAAPVSGRSCVAYDLHVEAHVVSFNARGRTTTWTQAARDQGRRSFLLLEGETARVAMTQAEIVVDHVEWCAATPELRAYLEGKSMDATGSFRYREHIIAPGDRVAVLGTARFEAAPSATGHTEGAAARSQRRAVLEARFVSNDPSTQL